MSDMNTALQLEWTTITAHSRIAYCTAIVRPKALRVTVHPEPTGWVFQAYTVGRFESIGHLTKKIFQSEVIGSEHDAKVAAEEWAASHI